MFLDVEMPVVNGNLTLFTKDIYFFQYSGNRKIKIWGMWTFLA